MPEREPDRTRLVGRQVGTAEDPDHARRMGERGDGGEQLGLDRLAGDEQIDRLDARRPRRLDEVLALADEQAELLPLPAALEPPHELQPRVRRRGDHAARSDGETPTASRAAFACSAIDAEGGRIADREVGEHLPVELDLRLAAAGDELVVREPVLARGRVDADDPEAAHRPLPVLAVAVGVDERVLDLLLGARVGLGLEAPVALGLLEDLAPLLARVDGSLDARHRPSDPSSF